MLPFGAVLRDPTRPSPQARPGRPRVLVVDDLPLMREAICRMLEHAGMTVVAATGDQPRTLSAVRDLAPDVILLDLRMRHVDALDVIRSIKQLDQAAQVVVHMGPSRPDLMAQALEAGAATVPARDGTPWELLRAVDRAYRTRRSSAGASGE
jgi:DNA-binding NarL/FixJ family response regulator